MTLPAGRPGVVVLLLAAGLLAALIGVVFAFAPGVGAHDCADFGTTPDVHMDTDDDVCGTTGHSTLTTHAALSSIEPGAQDVAIRLTAKAEADISANATITVDFSWPSSDSGFSIPSTLADTDNFISLDSSELTAANVQVNSKKVILTAPSQISQGTYTITFNTAAGIRNPAYEGHWPITVSSNVTGDETDTITAVIGRTRITPPEGPRGQTFRLRGEGYPTGTVTIFDGNNSTADEGEILDTKEVTSSGTFTSNLVRVPGNLSGLVYRVWTKDSVGGVGSVIYHITEPTTSFDPATARVSDPVTGRKADIVTISIADWQLGSTGVAAVLIQGQQAYGVTEYQNPNDTTEYCYDNTGLKSADSNNIVSFEVNVPDGTLPGMQTVEVYTEDQLAHMPCIDTNIDTWTRQPDRDATLESDATPVIQKTIDIVSDLPEPTERVNIFEVDGDWTRN